MAEFQGGMMNAILRWSMAQHDGTRPSELKEMSPERKEFLRKAFDEMLDDPIKRMKAIVEILKWPSTVTEFRPLIESTKDMLIQLQMRVVDLGNDSSNSEIKTDAESLELDDENLLKMIVTRKENALDELDELCEDINNAQDLHKVGGLRPLVAQLNSPYSSLVMRSAQVISNIVSNNDVSQKQVMDVGAVPTLLELFQTHTKLMEDSEEPASLSEASQLGQVSSEKLLIKAVTCLSKVVDHFPPAQKVLIDSGGLEALNCLIALETADRLKVKCFSLVRALFNDESEYSTVAIQSSLDGGILESIAQLIGHNSIDLREFSLDALLTMTKSSALALQACQDQDGKLELSDKLKLRVAELTKLTDSDDIDMMREELNMLMTILELVYCWIPGQTEKERRDENEVRERKEIEAAKSSARSVEQARRNAEAKAHEAQNNASASSSSPPSSSSSSSSGSNDQPLLLGAPTEDTL